MSRKGFLRIKDILREDFSTPGGWKENLLFTGMNNFSLAQLTDGRFIVRDSAGAHPVFLLRKVERDSFLFCPCSSKESNMASASYIRKGSMTPPSRILVEKTTFIINLLSFNLNATSQEADRLALRGLVSDEDIIGNFHKRGCQG